MFSFDIRRRWPRCIILCIIIRKHSPPVRQTVKNNNEQPSPTPPLPPIHNSAKSWLLLLLGIFRINFLHCPHLTRVNIHELLLPFIYYYDQNGLSDFENYLLSYARNTCTRIYHVYAVILFVLTRIGLSFCILNSAQPFV